MASDYARWTYVWSGVTGTANTGWLDLNLPVIRLGALYVTCSGLVSAETLDLTLACAWTTGGVGASNMHDFTQFTTASHTSELVMVPSGYGKEGMDVAGLPGIWRFSATATGTATLTFYATLVD